MPGLTDDIQGLARRLVDPLRAWFVSWDAGCASGAWTPALEGLSTAGTLTYSVQLGAYQRVGSWVSVMAVVQWSGRPVAPAGDMVITGLPIVGVAKVGLAGLMYVSASALSLTGIGTDGQVSDGESRIRLRQVFAAAGAAYLDGAAIGTSGQLLVQGMYTV